MEAVTVAVTIIAPQGQPARSTSKRLLQEPTVGGCACALTPLLSTCVLLCCQGACCIPESGSCTHEELAGTCTGFFSTTTNCTACQAIPAGTTCSKAIADSSFSCNPGTYVNTQNSGKSTVDQDTCCLPTCNNTNVDSPTPMFWKCPRTWTFSAFPAKYVSPMRDVDCCDLPSTPEDLPDVTVMLTAPAAVVVGDTAKLTLVVKLQSGLDGARGVVAKVTLPDGLEFTGSPPSEGTVVPHFLHMYCLFHPCLLRHGCS